MELIAKEAMSVKLVADYIEKRKIEVLTKSTEEIYDRLPPWVNEALVRSTIPKKCFSDFSEKDDIYGYDRLAVAVIIVVSGQAIPETLWVKRLWRCSTLLKGIFKSFNLIIENTDNVSVKISKMRIVRAYVFAEYASLQHLEIRDTQ